MRVEVHILVYCPIDTFQWGLTHSAVILVERPPTPFSDALMSFLLKKRTCNIFQAKHLYSSVILQKPDRGQIYY